MTGRPLLEVEGVACRYGRVKVLQEVSLTVREGELLALIGANGAGKTTLLKAVAGVLGLASGRIRYGGVDVSSTLAFARVRRGIALVPEGRQIWPDLSGEDNLVLGGFTRPRAELRDDLETQYGRFPILREKRTVPAGMLSGGQQQLLAIGRALMSRPRLLLLDEPSMGLAPLLVAEIFEIVAQLRRAGVTVLLVEQNAREALRVADRAYVLESGRIVADGSGAELLADERIQRAYLGS